MLFDPVKVGPYTLPNRVVMAPMTRSRAKAGFVPSDMAPTYYAQRASAGLIVTEATQVSPQGIGYVHTPGIYSDAQVEGWKTVTDAVHKAGGRIFLQLWHVGRISNPTLQPDNALPVAPSAIAPKGESMTIDYKMTPYVTPRALETAEIAGIVADFRKGAENAKRAGFDGVEIHGANGYLIDQFLRDGSNHRTDQYGGSVENRARFLIEVTEAVVAVWGGDRVGVRLSPNTNFNDMHDSNPRAIFGHAAKALERFNLAYLHVTRASDADDVPGGPIDADFFRPLFRNTIISAAGYTSKEEAEQQLKTGNADLIAFGTLFISNPDLPLRLQQNAPLAKGDRATFYGGDAKGYIDYPSLEAAVA
jgi:N-ethylmaleimide reductase